MPERFARTPATEQVRESIGSGPFRFVANEWVSGASTVWTKFEKYRPRQEPPSTLAGGNVAPIERVEWVVQPDPATASAAPRTGEVDWVEWPLTDLLPMLKRSSGVTVNTINWPHLCVLAFNRLHPPFDNPRLRRALYQRSERLTLSLVMVRLDRTTGSGTAMGQWFGRLVLLPAADQRAFVHAVLGDQTEPARTPAGFFTEGTPMANKAGPEVLSGPRDRALARKLVAESGYKGEPILLLAPTDSQLFAQLAQVNLGLFMDLGLNVDFREMDFGSLMTRRVNPSPPDKGGWNAVAQIWTVLNSSNPGNSIGLRAPGPVRRGVSRGQAARIATPSGEVRQSAAGDDGTRLNIPFGNKELAMSLGARYRTGGWFAPPGTRLEPFQEKGWLK